MALAKGARAHRETIARYRPAQGVRPKEYEWVVRSEEGDIHRGSVANLDG